MKRLLVLENGDVFEGESFGSPCEREGEIIFHTSMTGLQEIISNPSYYGQIIVMTNPIVGISGINRDDFESIVPNLAGVVVKEVAEFTSHFRSTMTLDNYLRKHSIPGLKGIDTRKLTRLIREIGTLKGKICSENVDVNYVLQQLKEQTYPALFAPRVSTTTRYMTPGDKERIVIIDFGVKKGIVKQLSTLGYEIIVVPYDTTHDEISSLMPGGVVLSNGPGDPRELPDVINVVKQLLGKVPIFGIALGHQILALACGAKVMKMKYGHHGCNYPVKDVRSGKVFITSQNHGYVVVNDSLVNTPFEVSHVNVNDSTIEGIYHKKYDAFGVQFYPEASPGPQDMHPIFYEFGRMVTQYREGMKYAETL